ncbi:very short patch repair endonuclease [Stenotrophomonas indicatrix]|uniref:very short patch repair endonuclease n=1 Tax=Stenotrophomonas indicatrix TaxID=2045451 RepID=UPI0015DD85C0|nr:very short patch repair endonuclease [Stenotrophomonas indicatrix]MBA0100328.1 DNA mismatch endonuclease Vsr [Stenotrophomonas indicatrix]
MADTLTHQQRSERMSRIRGADTSPELQVRRGLHAMGFRFRLHDRALPGRPDVVMRKYATVIFVQGCYWHAHHCQKGRIPATNTLFWKEKFESNRKRDARSARKLRAMGWHVLHIWECELRTPSLRSRALEKLARKIRRAF